MKRYKMALFIILLTGIAAGALSAAENVSLEKGKALFSDPKLGTNGKSCDNCHHDGKGLQQAGNKADLDRIVNACIVHSIKGKALDPKSVEMQSLLLYIKNLSAKPAAAKPSVGC